MRLTYMKEELLLIENYKEMHKLLAILKKPRVLKATDLLQSKPDFSINLTEIAILTGSSKGVNFFYL